MLGAAAGVGIVGVLYGLIEAFKAASPGKMILKIKIGTAEGADASTAQLFQRYAMKNSSNICTLLALVTGLGFIAGIGNLLGFVVLVGCFFVLGASRQALHDMIAKTAVYDRDRASGAAEPVAPAAPPPVESAVGGEA